MKRTISIAVLALCVIGAIYYSFTQREPRGAVVVLLGVLYFEALPHLWVSSS